MGEIRIVGPGKTCGYPYLVCKKKWLFPMTVPNLEFSQRFQSHCVFDDANFVLHVLGFKMKAMRSRHIHLSLCLWSVDVDSSY